MMRRIVLSGQAEADVREHAACLANDNLRVALAFIDAVKETTQRLAFMPHIGKRLGFESKGRDIRFWPVRGFPKLLITYVVDSNAVEVIRVLHGARDLTALLGDE